MKAATLRQFLSAHSWMGLLAGMALFIAFYVGAITVFTHELNDWPRAPVPAAAATQTPELAAQALLDAVLARHPALAESFSLMLPGEHGARPRLYAFGPAARPFGGAVQFQLGADGQLLQLPQRSGFVDFLYDLHFTAGLPRTFAGKVGTCGPWVSRRTGRRTAWSRSRRRSIRTRGSNSARESLISSASAWAGS